MLRLRSATGGYSVGTKRGKEEYKKRSIKRPKQIITISKTPSYIDKDSH